MLSVHRMRERALGYSATTRTTSLRRSPGTTAGIPGGYGVICSAAMCPAALSAGTCSTRLTQHVLPDLSTPNPRNSMYVVVIAVGYQWVGE